jgi:hypothetical protein
VLEMATVTVTVIAVEHETRQRVQVAGIDGGRRRRPRRRGWEVHVEAQGSERRAPCPRGRSVQHSVRVLQARQRAGSSGALERVEFEVEATVRMQSLWSGCGVLWVQVSEEVRRYA